MTTDKQARKERPIARGVLDYFPDAIAEVAYVSHVGNEQHNPGQPLHWSRGKSSDHADCVVRHLMERGQLDDDGLRHSAKAAWRSLAMLQIEIEGDMKPKQSNGEAEYGDAPAAVCDCGGYCSCRQTEPAPEPESFGRDPEAECEAETERLNQWLVQRDAYTSFDHAAEQDWKKILSDAMPHRPLRDSGRTEVVQRLIRLGCIGSVALQIADGTTFAHPGYGFRGSVYIAGPMRNIPEFNFPAFDAARDRLRIGRNVISPADIDKGAGVKEKEHPTGDAAAFDQRVFCYRDFYSLYYLAHVEGGAIAMLPGWEKSTGALAEFFLARWLGLKVLDATTGRPLAGFYGTDIVMAVDKFLLENREA